MRTAPFVLVLLLAAAPCSAENLTPERCRQIADSTFPALSAFDGLRKNLESAGIGGLVKSAKGRFQQAAEETEQARKDFLSAAETYRMALAFLYNEAKNCENGITLERTPE